MATDFSDSSTENPKKRIKTENQTLENSSPTALSSSKGKSKIEFENNVCGICLSEAQHDNNGVSRGFIDSCDHYFCFVCIMEWSKLESKCPLCKRRFSNIRRPAKPPVFPSDRLIHVPVRDQVYHYFGNATAGPFDPYSEAKCSICQSSVDESLLLLCDLCDSAAHTYCAGLGATVPEGDWFCHDCTLLKDEHNKAEIDSDSKDQSNSCNLNESPSKEENVSIFDIVREPHIGVGERSSASGRLVNIARNDDASLEDDFAVSASRRQESTMQDATKLAARTLRQCRNVHERIRALRQNWNGIRSGSLSFSFRKSDCGQNANSKSEICVNSEKSSSTSCSSQKVKSVEGCPTEPEISVNSGQSSSKSCSNQIGKTVICCPVTSSNRDSCEISKAWKMMDIAKSMEKGRSTLPEASKHLSSGISKIENFDCHSGGKNQNMLKSQASENLSSGNRKGKNFDFHSGGKNQNIMKSQMLERQNLCSLGCEINSTDSVISPLPINCQSISSHNIQDPVKRDFQNGSDRSSPEKISFESSFTASHFCESSAPMSSSFEPATAASNSFRARDELHSLSSSKKESSIAKGAEVRSPIYPMTMRSCEAKSEIQSLVKLNLKLLTKERKLENDVFKEVARRATHSILAACGLEYPKHGLLQFSNSVCCHEESNQQFRRSTLMPNSCRECFYVFVKDVVNTIMLEKMGYGNVS